MYDWYKMLKKLIFIFMASEIIKRIIEKTKKQQQNTANSQTKNPAQISDCR